MVVCRYYLQGYCRYGDRCRFDHPYKGGGGFQAPQPGGQASQAGPAAAASATPQTFTELLDGIATEMKMWENSKQWPLSCFSPLKGQPCIPGIDDYSPEELRTEAYKCKVANTPDKYLQHVNQLMGQYKQKREALKNPTPEIRNYLQQQFQTSSGGAGFGLSKPGGPAVGSVFGGSSAGKPSLFGGSSAGQGSVFGGSSGGQTSVFGGSSGGQTSVFGGSSSGQTSVFGGSVAVQGSAFGRPPATQTSVFGGSSTGQTPLFGGPSASQSSVFGGSSASQPSVFGGPSAGQTSVFGGSSAGQTPMFGGGSAGQRSVFGSGALFGAGGGSAGSGSGSVFGSTPGSAGAVASTSFGSGSVFGSPSAAPSGQTNPSAVGGATQTSAFGAGGSQPGSSAFGAAGPQQQPPAGGSVFGLNPSAGLVGPRPGVPAVPACSGGGLFGKAGGEEGPAPGTPALAAGTEHAYSEPASLTAEEKAQFQAADFTLGRVPIKPPPRDMCVR